jgi:transposase
MRGYSSPQKSLICLVNIEERIPRQHPIRQVKTMVEEVLRSMEGSFEKLYADTGRASVPPERLLKARVLMALYTVRSERQFCERLRYDVLFQWFLDINMEEADTQVFDASVFAKNQQRFLQGAISEEFFTQVVGLGQQHGWVSDEHFSVDGTLIDAWASMKSFRPKDEPKDPADSNGWSDFKGQKRSNQTHESKTDAEAKLLRKGPGAAAKLCFGMHATMENRHGLCVVLDVHQSVGTTETTAALGQLDKLCELGLQPQSLGADKGYHNHQFVQGCRERGVVPHCAQIEGRRIAGLDGRTTKRRACKTSLIVRRRIEQIFGWTKTIGGLRKAAHRGVARVHAACQYVCGAYNLLRMARLRLKSAAPPYGVAGA